MTLLNWFVAIILVICAIVIAAAREKAVELSPLQVCSLLGCGCLLKLILNRQNKWFCCTASPGAPSGSPQTSQLSKTEGKAVKVNESLYDLHKPEGSPSLQVLFFHGFQFGDYTDAHLSTWESGDGSCIWPQAWLVDKFPGAHVISVSYDAHVAKSSPEGTFDMYLIGENLISDLMEADIGQLPGCPVALVGHSFGGLVIKQLCLHAHDGESLHSRVDSKQLKSFLDNVKGIFYYATPHHGSSCMEKAAHYSLSGPLLDYVKVLSTEAARLNSRFDHLCKSYNHWRIQVLGEQVPTKSDVFHNEVVASEASARGGDQFNVAEGTDHISICKPKGKTSRSFYALTGLLTNIVKEQAKVKERAFEEAGAGPKNFQLLPKQIVGIDHVVEEVKAKLEKITCLGLVGMGGVGKTTLAKRLFNVLSPKYEYTCFIKKVKNCNGKVEQAILENLHHNGNRIADNTSNLSLLKGKRLFLVLDDVAKEEGDLEVLSNLTDIIEVDAESRFIITSRNARISDEIYQVPHLNDDSSTKLFTSLAFRDQKYLAPPPLLQGLAVEAVAKCAGLPLALEVLGNYLYKRSVQIWEQAIQALEKADKVANFDEKLWAVLKLSYDSLKREDQEMFLDATTIWNGEFMLDAMEHWKTTTNGSEHLRWQDLVDMSLVWKDDKKVGMHEQLRDLGRRIALTSSENGKVSRIWESQKAWGLLSRDHCIANEIKDVVALRLDGRELKKNVEESNVEMLDGAEINDYLDESDDENEGNSSSSSTTRSSTCNGKKRLCIARNTLSKMPKLQCLLLKGVDIDSVRGATILSELVTLRWDDSQLTELPFDPESVSRLEIVYLVAWPQLQSLPSKFGQLTTLRILHIENVDQLESLPQSFGQLVNLEDLQLERCRLKSLPNSFGHLVHLEHMALQSCKKLESLPETFGRLPKLKHLEFLYCGLRSLPSTIGQLSQLQTLKIFWCHHLKALPVSFGRFPVLQKLQISYCWNLQELPATFGQLTGLKTLSVMYCNSLTSLPDSFGSLAALETLKLSCCENLTTLPDSFYNLSRMKTLRIYHCCRLHRLPDTFGQLVGLQDLHLRNSFLETIPDSIECLHSLKTLKLNWVEGTAFPMLPRSLGDVITELNYFRNFVVDFMDERFSLSEVLEDKEKRCPWGSHPNMMKKVRVKDYKTALKDYVLDVETLSDSDRSYFLQERGILKRLNDDLEGALQDLSAALDRDLERGEDDYECRKHRGFVKFLRGDHEGARIDGERAMEIKPSDVDRPDYAFDVCSDGSLELSFLGGERIQFLDFDLK